MSKKILVTGSNGQLGSECRKLSSSFPDNEFIFVSRQELPIDDIDAVSDFFSSNKIDFCINCAAYTAVDKAESDKEMAFNINAQAVEHLAKCCHQNNVQFIHISTDYVFDGKNNVGYIESDATGPLNVYGESKLAGEIAAMKVNPNVIIIRTSWVYSAYGNNFVKTMMRLMKERDSINVVNDQIGKPTYAADLAGAIFYIIFSGETIMPGIYHYANDGIISWYDFACEIKRIGGYDCIINPIPSSAYPVPAKRPDFSILNTAKITSTYGMTIPQWDDSLRQCMSLLM